jgi:hypothetical protein
VPVDVRRIKMILGPSILNHREDEKNVTLYKICEVTKKEYSVTLSRGQYEMLKSSNCPLIQRFLPDLSADQREFLMSGTTPDEWNTMFSEDD